jgi:hypothetical protein
MKKSKSAFFVTGLTLFGCIYLTFTLRVVALGLIRFRSTLGFCNAILETNPRENRDLYRFAVSNNFLTGTASTDDVIRHNGWKLEEDWAILIEAQPHVNQRSFMGKDGLGGGESKGRR